ncbi:MAG: PTS transporter subunit EIIC [Lachnospiraceae bacterium]|nr:PTS transporter subunit EIIC [Lachnospiraceae bacterium]
MKKKFLNKASIITNTIKVSLAMAIPILFVGSITVLLNGFPIQEYQDFLDAFLGGALRSIIGTVQSATVGTLAVYITVALSFSYMNQTEAGSRLVSRFGSLLACVTGFFILVGFFSGEPDFSLLSGQGVFSALLAGLIGSALFSGFESFFKTRKTVFVDGADSVFNATLQVIKPFLCVVLCFAAANYLITVLFDVKSVQYLFMKGVNALFQRTQRSYSSGLLFTTLISIMWCFGIHGNNVLNQVAEDMFVAIIPGSIVSKSFIDTFVNMGGTGCTIGLLIALAIFGKRSSTKKLVGMAALPGIFNIGELLVFGYPVIYNPLMALPFILAPMICFSNAFLMTMIGFLPPVTSSVVWTTPALMSGYVATGSVNGIIVQLVNIALSTACYAPFVILNEKKSLNEFSSEMKGLVENFKAKREKKEELSLTECDGNRGRLARLLATDLVVSLDGSLPEEDIYAKENPLKVDYQLQYDQEDRPKGARAILNWEHKRYGTIYPPIALQLARESGDLYELETYIIERALKDSLDYRERYGEGFVMIVNVSSETIADDQFIYFLQGAADRYRMRRGNVRLEISGEAKESVVEKIRLLGCVVETNLAQQG